MGERQDQVAGRVQRGTRHAAGWQGAIGTLRAYPERRTRDQQRREGEQPAATCHSPPPTPTANGRSSPAIAAAVCHRSSRCFASARVSTGEIPLGTSRRRLRTSGGFWCWCMSSTAAALTDENGGRPARASNSTTPSEYRSVRPSTSGAPAACSGLMRSEEHTSELQSHSDLVCRLLLEKKKMLCACSLAVRTGHAS